MCDRSLRVVQTVHSLAGKYPIEYCNLLRELNGGDYSRMTYEEIRQHYPEEYIKRERNKLEYRYPDGESYIDVKERLSQVIMKIVGSRNSVLIVGHVVCFSSRLILSNRQLFELLWHTLLTCPLNQFLIWK